MPPVAIDNPGWRLRTGHTAPIATASPIDYHPRIPLVGKLGRNKGHKPRLKLSDYIDRSVAPPPSAVARPHPGLVWQMFLNDQLGDCVIAMILHSIMDFHSDAGTAIPTLVDQDAENWYELIGNYKHGDPSTDQGCDESVAMQKWKDGLTDSLGNVHQIVDTVAVNPADLVECRIAIYEFVALQCGVALPQSAQGQTEWAVVGDPKKDPGSQPGSWGGHGIPEREYDPDTFKVVTWGAELLVTVPFHQTYMEECHVVVTKEMLNNSGVGPSGVQWGDLLSDINKLPPVQAKEDKPKTRQPSPKAKAAESAPEQESGDESGQGGADTEPETASSDEPKE